MNRIYLNIAGSLAACACLGVGAWYLRPALQLIPQTKQLVGTTGEILTQTQQLQGAIGDVRTNLGQLTRQEQLLTDQEALARRVVAGLDRQTQLSGQTRTLLSNLLTAEKSTADTIHQADAAGAATLTAVRASQAKVQDLGAQVNRIQGGSATLSTQLDDLHVQLSAAADNFAVIGRLKDAAASAEDQAKTGLDQAKQEARSWWQRAVEWLRKW